MASGSQQRFPALPHWSLWEAESGGDRLECRGQIFPLGRHQTICIPPGNSFQYMTLGDNTSHRLTFLLPDFDHDLTREYFPDPVLLNGIPHLSDQPHDSNRVISIARLQAFILTCMATLLESLPKDSLFLSSHRGSDLAIIRPAISFINENLHRKITVAQLSRLAQVTSDHFTKVFRRTMGKTPAHYMRGLRVALAAEKLKGTKDSIDRIYLDTGFQNRFHFSRVFRQLMGVPPGRYRCVMQGQAGTRM